MPRLDKRGIRQAAILETVLLLRWAVDVAGDDGMAERYGWENLPRLKKEMLRIADDMEKGAGHV